MELRFYPVPIYLYRFLILLAIPVIIIFMGVRLWRGKEDRKRFFERLAISKVKRPKGKLIWFHAVSVGESLAALSLIALIDKHYPHHHFLLTTTTKTSARLVATRATSESDSSILAP